MAPHSSTFRSPGREDPLEKEMAPHSSTLAWKIPWMEEPGRLKSMGSLESDTTERLHFHFSLSCTGEGNGNPLQRSCLENPRDGEAWWAAIYGVAQSRTRLKRLSSSSSRTLSVFQAQMSRSKQKSSSEVDGSVLYFLKYYTVRLKMFYFCVCFLYIICVKSTINLLQQNTTEPIVIAGP